MTNDLSSVVNIDHVFFVKLVFMENIIVNNLIGKVWRAKIPWNLLMHIFVVQQILYHSINIDIFLLFY